MDDSVACAARCLASSAFRRQASLSDDMRGGSSNAPNREEKPRRSGAKNTLRKEGLWTSAARTIPSAGIGSTKKSLAGRAGLSVPKGVGLSRHRHPTSPNLHTKSLLIGTDHIAQCLNLEREFHHTASKLCILGFEPLE